MCQFYRTGEELADILVPYFAAGLTSNERCVWVVTEPLDRAASLAALERAVPDLDQRLRRGQIDVVEYSAWYHDQGRLDGAETVRRWLTLEEQAIARGYAGLRISGNTASVAREDWVDFRGYEAEVHQAFHTRRIIALCSYSLERCGSNEIIDVLRHHRVALVRRDSSWDVVQSATLMLAAVAGTLQEPAPGQASELAMPLRSARGARLEGSDGRGQAPGDSTRLLAELRYTARTFAAESCRRKLPEAERSLLWEAEREARVDAQLAAEHLARLQRVTSALCEAATQDDIARVVVNELASVVGADQIILAVPVADESQLVLLSHAGLQREVSERFKSFPTSTHLPIATAYRTGMPLWLPTITALRESYPDLSSTMRTQAIACMPLALSGRRLGAIGLGFFAPRQFSPAERALYDDLAKQVALALERAHLYDEARRGHDRLQLLADAAAWVSLAKLDLGKVLDSMVAEVTRHFADAAVISLRDGQAMRLTALRHVDPEIEAAFRATLEAAAGEIGEDLLGAVAWTGTSLLISHVDQATIEAMKPACREHFRRYPIASMVAVALRSGDEVLGTLMAMRDRRGDPFTADDERMLCHLADRVALAIENALLFQRAQADRKRAEDANRAKDEFLAMLGHELRNPLSPIRTVLQLMELRAGDTFVKERAIIERQVNHMIRLVDDLLDVSRITRGKIELVRGPLEIAEIIGRAIEMVSPLLEQRAHALHLAVPASGLVVEGDAHRLAQVVANLLANAAKYTPPGGAIDVRARARDHAVEISVSDNGSGIDGELLPHVFDLFVQGRQSIDRSQGGLGLGLAIVRTLVEMHGGTVGARSGGRGKGSEFTVVLPPARCQDRGLTVDEPVPAASRRATALRILVVDDNTDGAQVLDHLLRTVGHDTRVAHDGPTALGIAGEFRPEVALLDIGLPVMDGYELGRRLRALLADAPPRLIAITGYGQSSDRARSREAGFDAHLVKPIALEQLDTVFEHLLGGRPG